MPVVHRSRAVTILCCWSTLAVAASLVRAQSFFDALNPATDTTVAGNPGTSYTASSTIYATSTITTTPGKYDTNNQYTGTAHTWTSINDAYVPAHMTAPSAGFSPVTFGVTDYMISNSDGKGYNANNRDQLLYTDFVSDQPTDASGTYYGYQAVWLVSPLITVNNGSTLRFWGKSSSDFSGAAGGDRLQLRMSTTGATQFSIGGYTPTGTTTGPAGGQAVYDGGDFTTALLDVNPTQLPDASGGFPTSWTAYNITLSGLPTSTSNPRGTTTVRFAFLDLSEHANPYATDGYANDISLDDFTVNVPEPTFLLVAPALIRLLTRRPRRTEHRSS